MKGLEISDVPCCECGGEVIEFSVPNGIWNAIVRKGGPEHDREYLCVSCFAKQCVSHASRLAPVKIDPEDEGTWPTEDDCVNGFIEIWRGHYDEYELADFDPMWQPIQLGDIKLFWPDYWRRINNEPPEGE